MTVDATISSSHVQRRDHSLISADPAKMRKLMALAGQSCRGLARDLDVSPTTVARAVQGRPVRPDVLRRIVGRLVQLEDRDLAAVLAR